MSDVALVAAYSLVWFIVFAIPGWLANRSPLHRLDHDTRLTRLRRFEHDGRAYELIGIRRWKDSLPEAGDLFRGGVSKRHLAGGDSLSLARFAAETRRAEWVHWSALAASLTFFVWNPWAIGAVMVGFGIAVNLPFIAIQRYNRARVLRVLRRRGITEADLARTSSGHGCRDVARRGEEVPQQLVQRPARQALASRRGARGVGSDRVGWLGCSFEVGGAVER